MLVSVLLMKDRVKNVVPLYSEAFNLIKEMKSSHTQKHK